MRVPARDDEADKGRLQLRVGKVVCRDVAADVVHRHQRKAHGVSRRELREIHADQNRTNQPRRIRHGNRRPGRLRVRLRLLRAPDPPDRKSPQYACATQFPAPRRRRACEAPPVTQMQSVKISRPSRTMATAVSSHEDSTDKIFMPVTSFLRMRASSFG